MAGGSNGGVRIGCSGWSYRDWRGPVYPPQLTQKQWFGYYATLFDTVELNTTFYRLPTQAAVEGWAAGAPAGFEFALKLGAFGSHRMKLRDAGSWLPNHLDRAERLGAALGPTLVQLPPKWRRNTERLAEFFSVAPTTMRWALEIREPSWLHDDVFALLARHNVALCIHDLIDDHPRVMTADWTYVRFHGPQATIAPYRGAYGTQRLHPWADWLCSEVQRGHDIYCYFNNDYDGHAVHDARSLREAVDRRLHGAEELGD